MRSFGTGVDRALVSPPARPHGRGRPALQRVSASRSRGGRGDHCRSGRRHFAPTHVDPKALTLERATRFSAEAIERYLEKR